MQRQVQGGMLKLVCETAHGLECMQRLCNLDTMHRNRLLQESSNCSAADVPLQLELPWGPPLFTDEERLRGMAYLGGGARMREQAAQEMTAGVGQ